ncbi:MAG: hypothetical protein ACE5IR_10435 [bacterium]
MQDFILILELNPVFAFKGKLAPLFHSLLTFVPLARKDFEVVRLQVELDGHHQKCVFGGYAELRGVWQVVAAYLRKNDFFFELSALTKKTDADVVKYLRVADRVAGGYRLYRLRFLQRLICFARPVKVADAADFPLQPRGRPPLSALFLNRARQLVDDVPLARAALAREPGPVMPLAHFVRPVPVKLDVGVDFPQAAVLIAVVHIAGADAGHKVVVVLIVEGLAVLRAPVFELFERPLLRGLG